MGTKRVTVAIKGVGWSEIAEALGLVPTGRIVRDGDAALTGAAIAGWYVVTAMGSDRYRFLSRTGLAALSAKATVVVSSINETSMESFAAGWERGVERWALLRSSGGTISKVSERGAVPPEFAAIRSAALAKQQTEREDVDHVIDAPLDLVANLIGVDPYATPGLRFDELRLSPDADASYPGFVLEVEERPSIEDPTKAQVLAEVNPMTPDGGPAILVLNGSHGGYIQTAGGDERFVLECREGSGDDFRHFRAVRPGATSSAEAKVRTNSFVITTSADAVFGSADVKAALGTYLDLQARASFLDWRDMTDMFR